jgi:signal transduction histidine kinase
MFNHHHHHHHDHFFRWYRPVTPIGRFVRARLRRRIFAWFTGGFLVTGLAVAAIMMLVVRIEEPQWSRTFEGSRVWLGSQFGRDWADPVARERYAREMAHDLGASIELRDLTGATVVQLGEPCGHRAVEFAVTREGQPLGQGRVCLAHSAAAEGRWWLLFTLGMSAIWFASGRVARRLAAPLDELTAVVQKIGSGDLKARTQLGCYQPDEIGVVAEAVNDMAARIEKQMSDQRELLATVSHEMRTPLARVRIISEIAREAGATPKTFDDLDREVVEMDSLVGDLLASSRVEFGQFSKRALSLRDVCSQAVERAGIAPEALRLVGEHDGLEADPTLLHRALANLFDNAKKHATGADAFEVTTTGSRVRFEVMDRGPGIRGDVDSLFRKFTRGAQGTDSGLGLGLALVKRIAEAHGGQVFAKNREGGGAIFGFEIDAAPRG